MLTKVSFKNEGKIKYILKLLFHDLVKKKINGKTMYTQKEFFSQSFVFLYTCQGFSILACPEKSTLPAVSSQGKSDAIFLEGK